MSLLGSQGGRTSTTQKNIKEGLLNEEIAKLREIYQDTSLASEKILRALRKVIAFKNQNPNVPFDQVSTLNHFMEDLSSIEESFITLIENCEADKQLFVSSVIFRDSDKQISSNFFKMMMKNHEDFKQKMNESILRLERDIQILETNGYHIYQATLKPNNVLSTLKKQSLEKFIISLTEMHIIFNKMKAQMSNHISVEKKSIKNQFKNDIQKFKESCKVAQQICLKQKLRNMMMTSEIHKAKVKVENESKKIKNFDQSIKINKKALKNLNNQMMIESEESINRNVFKQYMKILKQKTDSLMTFNPKLYKSPSMRSKSCHTLIVTQQKHLQLKQKDESYQESETHLIGSDFLEESIES